MELASRLTRVNLVLHFIQEWPPYKTKQVKKNPHNIIYVSAFSALARTRSHPCNSGSLFVLLLEEGKNIIINISYILTSGWPNGLSVNVEPVRMSGVPGLNPGGTNLFFKKYFFYLNLTRLYSRFDT